MLATARHVLTDPDTFFEDRAAEPQLLVPISIVAAYIVLRIAAGLPFILLIEADLLLVLSYGIIGLGLVNVVIGFFAWFIFAGVFQVLSYLFGGSGSFRRTFTIIGWGFLPLLAGKFLMVIAVSIAAQEAPAIPLQTSEQMVKQMRAVTLQYRDGPTILIASLVSAAMSIWSGYIWVFAVKHTRDLSTREALITVVVPGVLFFIVGNLL